LIALLSRRRKQEVESSGLIEVDPNEETGVYYAEEIVDSKTFKKEKPNTGEQNLLKPLPNPEQYWIAFP
jgi:hypothetical protein